MAKTHKVYCVTLTLSCGQLDDASRRFYYTRQAQGSSRGDRDRAIALRKIVGRKLVEGKEDYAITVLYSAVENHRAVGLHILGQPVATKVGDDSPAAVEELSA